MHRTPYSADNLNFAYSIQVYFRWGTYRRRPISPLSDLDIDDIRGLAKNYGIHTLECSSDSRNAILLASLRPSDPVSACASKLKGRLTKHIRELPAFPPDTSIFSKGYFATTFGKNTRSQVSGYLSKQSQHHGYEVRPKPPVYEKEFSIAPENETVLHPNHAVASLRYHIVLATSFRKGVFGSASGPAITKTWQSEEANYQFRILKASFLPDHVHLAVRIHPAVCLSELVTMLMNSAQDFMWERFREHAIEAGIDRLFQPSAYIGSYGDINSRAIKSYLNNWNSSHET